MMSGVTLALRAVPDVEDRHAVTLNVVENDVGPYAWQLAIAVAHQPAALLEVSEARRCRDQPRRHTPGRPGIKRIDVVDDLPKLLDRPIGPDYPRHLRGKGR